jgi:hypothetical protein
MAGFLRFLLIKQVLVDKILAMSTREVFLLSPKSCANPSSDSRDRELDLGELTRG